MVCWGICGKGLLCALLNVGMGRCDCFVIGATRLLLQQYSRFGKCGFSTQDVGFSCLIVIYRNAMMDFGFRVVEESKVPLYR